MKFLSSNKGFHLTQAQLVIAAFGLILLAALIITPALLVLRGQARADRLADATEWPTLEIGAQDLGAQTPTGAITSAPDGSPTPLLGPTAPAQPTSHVVAPGETLLGIAVRYGVSLDALLLANGFALDTVIMPGQTVIIPAGGSTPTPPQGSPEPIDTPPPVPDDNPLSPWSIPALVEYPYDGGAIHKDYLWASNDAYEVWSVSYLSDGIRVTGLIHIPSEGTGPFPSIILLHGGIDQTVYEQGADTAVHADIFARHGYLTFAPDYRTYNETEGTGSPLKLPWVIDSMNAIDALSTLPEADPARIGVFGHSRGGGIAGYLMVLSPDVDASILYAPLHTDQAVVWDIYANTFGAEWPREDAAIYGSPDTNPVGYQIISPFHYLDQVAAPVQIHHGAADSVLPAAWSRELYARLLDLGKTVEYYEYPGGEHTLYQDDFDQMMERSVAFFDEWVK